MIVKVKEPQAGERAMLREGQILFTYLHLAPDPEQTRGPGRERRGLHRLRDRHRAGGGLPLLAPMSEVAGRMAMQAGAHYLEKAHGGRACCSAACRACRRRRSSILGGGVVGTNAAQMAVGMGADVTVLDRSVDALRDAGRHVRQPRRPRCSRPAKRSSSRCSMPTS